MFIACFCLGNITKEAGVTENYRNLLFNILVRNYLAIATDQMAAGH